MPATLKIYMITDKINHYEYLKKYFPAFLEKLEIDPQWFKGMIVAHGDKYSQYQYSWADAGIPFHQGAAIYLLTYIRPYAEENREQKDGSFVAPDKWVITNKDKFLPILAELEKTIP